MCGASRPVFFGEGTIPQGRGRPPLEHLLTACFRSGPFWGQLLLFFLVLGKKFGEGGTPPLKSPPLHARLPDCGLGDPFGNKFWEINIEGNKFGGGTTSLLPSSSNSPWRTVAALEPTGNFLWKKKFGNHFLGGTPRTSAPLQPPLAACGFGALSGHALRPYPRASPTSVPDTQINRQSWPFLVFMLCYCIASI